MSMKYSEGVSVNNRSIILNLKIKNNEQRSTLVRLCDHIAKRQNINDSILLSGRDSAVEINNQPIDATNNYFQKSARLTMSDKEIFQNPDVSEISRVNSEISNIFGRYSAISDIITNVVEKEFKEQLLTIKYRMRDILRTPGDTSNQDFLRAFQTCGVVKNCFDQVLNNENDFTTVVNTIPQPEPYKSDILKYESTNFRKSFSQHIDSLRSKINKANFIQEGNIKTKSVENKHGMLKLLSGNAKTLPKCDGSPSCRRTNYAYIVSIVGDFNSEAEFLRRVIIQKMKTLLVCGENFIKLVKRKISRFRNQDNAKLFESRLRTAQAEQVERRRIDVGLKAGDSFKPTQTASDSLLMQSLSHKYPPNSMSALLEFRKIANEHKSALGGGNAFSVHNDNFEQLFDMNLRNIKDVKDRITKLVNEPSNGVGITKSSDIVEKLNDYIAICEIEDKAMKRPIFTVFNTRFIVKFDWLQIAKQGLTNSNDTGGLTPLIDKIFDSQLFDISCEILRLQNRGCGTQENVVTILGMLEKLGATHSENPKFFMVQKNVGDAIKRLNLVESDINGKKVLLTSVLSKVDEKKEREDTIRKEEGDLALALKGAVDLFYQKQTSLIADHHQRAPLGGVTNGEFEHFMGELLKTDILILEAMLTFMVASGINTNEIINKRNIKTYDFSIPIISTYNESENVIIKDLLDALDFIVVANAKIDVVSYKQDHTQMVKQFNDLRSHILKIVEEREHVKNLTKERIVANLADKTRRSHSMSKARGEIDFSNSYLTKLQQHLQKKALAHSGFHAMIDYILTGFVFLRLVFWKNIMLECLSVLI